MPLRLAAAALATLLAPPALAADGVLEINQTCATTTGCFTDDKGGFPVTITDLAPGKSFRLTSDLVVGSVSDTAISVRTSFVRIDLGGFTLRGPVTCSGTPTVCSASGLGDGVAVDATARESVEVRNGAVIGMGEFGVFVGVRGVVEGVRAHQNGRTGIFGDSGAAVRGCAAASNGDDGIVVSLGGLLTGSVANNNAGVGLGAVGSQSVTIIGNTSRANGDTGIAAGAFSVVKDNASTTNNLHGISAGAGSLITDNAAHDNGGHGIACTDRCNVSRNAVSANGDAIDEHGIKCSRGCAVQSNTAESSSGFGLGLGTESAYRDNVLVDNATGPVSGGVNRGSNHCAGPGTLAATCP